MFELFIIALVLSVFVCFIILIRTIDPNWKDVFNGYVPSKTLFKPGALYTSIGILGATVMPHALFLGSSLATQDRISKSPLPTTFSFPFRFGSRKDCDDPSKFQSPSSKSAEFDDKVIGEEPEPAEPAVRNQGILRRIFYLQPVSETPGHGSPEITEVAAPNQPSGAPTTPVATSSPTDGVDAIAPNLSPSSTTAKKSFWTSYSRHTNNSLEFVKAHLGHAIVDIVMSLLGFAVAINSAILILSSAAFFYSSNMDPDQEIGLFDAHALIRERVGKPAAFLFALALLCSGQSASLTATLAGQVVSEGFIAWRVSPVLRRTFTRLIGLIPATIIAAAMGRHGIDALLIASQVVLSLVLPFVVLPLVVLTSSNEVMTVKSVTTDPQTGEEVVTSQSYSNHWFITGLSYLLWFVIVVANAYVLVSLAMGKGG
jgi:metal iron transporter